MQIYPKAIEQAKLIVFDCIAANLQEMKIEK